MENGVIRGQLVDFLDDQSVQRRDNMSCENCGSKMQYREFHFWLNGTGLTWNIRVPVCAECGGQEPIQPPSHLHAA